MQPTEAWAVVRPDGTLWDIQYTQIAAKAVALKYTEESRTQGFNSRFTVVRVRIEEMRE